MTKHRLNDGRDLRRGSIIGTQPGEGMAALDATSGTPAERLERKNRLRAARGRPPVDELGPRAKRQRFKPAQPFRNAHEDRLSDPPPIAEWDNPHRKMRLEKWERDQIRAVRQARESAASDPANPVDRAAIIRRDDKTCWICKKRLEVKEIELDHVVPLIRGGKHVPENLRVSCRSCNAWHGDRLVQPL